LYFRPVQTRPSFSLKPFNTFGLDAHAQRLEVVDSLDAFRNAWNSAVNEPLSPLILGGGSNVLLVEDYPGLVIINRILGKQLLQEEGQEVIVECKSGENWHDVVLWSLEQGWYGLENLSLIPGTVGAAPMQNIGAYGVELKDVFHSLIACNLHTGQLDTFYPDDCQFGYRESVFKHTLKNGYFIYAVRFQLRRNPSVTLSYGDIVQTLQSFGITPDKATPKDVSHAVIAIRQSKLPDPSVLGNAGSFFKNPVVSSDTFLQLQARFPDIKGYENGGEVKLAAGWLIEHCGWKGKKIKHCGSHEKQALVLVNYGNATGMDVLQLAKDIRASVKQTFDLLLEFEVNIIAPMTGK
jgi:UDP-N-acetylmuramate dehydrogenase